MKAGQVQTRRPSGIEADEFTAYQAIVDVTTLIVGLHGYDTPYLESAAPITLKRIKNARGAFVSFGLKPSVHDALGGVAEMVVQMLGAQIDCADFIDLPSLASLRARRTVQNG